MITTVPVRFIFQSKQIRVFMDDDGKALFVGKDVCDALGYVNHYKAMKQHCREVAIYRPIADSRRRVQSNRVLAESDVIRLMATRKLPAAKKFKRMMFREILPEIRVIVGHSTRPATPEQIYPINRLISNKQVVPFIDQTNAAGLSASYWVRQYLLPSGVGTHLLLQ